MYLPRMRVGQPTEREQHERRWGHPARTREWPTQVESARVSKGKSRGGKKVERGQIREGLECRAKASVFGLHALQLPRIHLDKQQVLTGYILSED